MSTPTAAADQRRQHRGLHASRPRSPKPTAPWSGTPPPPSPSPSTPAARPAWAGPTPAPPPPPSSTTNSPAPSVGRDAHDIAGGWSAMHRACRNLGTKGLVMQAISAVDMAWWDLKARLLDVSAHDAARPVPHRRADLRLRRVHHPDRRPTRGTGRTGGSRVGCTAMKIKIGESWGTGVDRDLARVEQLRDAGRPGRRADGRRQRRLHARPGPPRRRRPRRPRRHLVRGTRQQRRHRRTGAPARHALRCDIAAGEYAADLYDVRALLPVVDCLQLDATRCGGYTGWLRGAALAQRTTCRSPPTAPRRCTPPSPPPSPTCATSNGSSTTPASNHYCSPAPRPPTTDSCIPTSKRRGTDSLSRPPPNR